MVDCASPCRCARSGARRTVWRTVVSPLRSTARWADALDGLAGDVVCERSIQYAADGGCQDEERKCKRPRPARRSRRALSRRRAPPEDRVTPAPVGPNPPAGPPANPSVVGCPARRLGCPAAGGPGRQGVGGLRGGPWGRCDGVGLRTRLVRGHPRCPGPGLTGRACESRLRCCLQPRSLGGCEVFGRVRAAGPTRRSDPPEGRSGFRRRWRSRRSGSRSRPCRPGRSCRRSSRGSTRRRRRPGRRCRRGSGRSRPPDRRRARRCRSRR